MRTCLLILFLTLVGRLAQAQDLLTKRNGDEVAVKILEITPTEVKYRRTDNPDGPLISVWRADVFMIRYANGTKEMMGNAPVPVRPAPATNAVPAAAGVPASPPLPTVGNLDPNDALLEQAIHLGGPRIGVTFLSPGIVDQVARERQIDLAPFLTQFGWQFESRLFRMPNGVSGLVEFVPLVGGLEQGRFLPSITGLLGIRSAKGLEFGVGPNITPLGTSVVLAVGASVHSYGVNFPINLALVPSRDGVRLSLLLGFNSRTR